VLSLRSLPLPPTCVFVTVIQAWSYVAATVLYAYFHGCSKVISFTAEACGSNIPFSFVLCLIPYLISEHDCTPLQCFYKGCIQINQQLALSWLMHSIHCGSTIFPYQVFERRPTEETLLGCVGLYNIIRRYWTFTLCFTIWSLIFLDNKGLLKTVYFPCLYSIRTHGIIWSSSQWVFIRSNNIHNYQLRNVSDKLRVHALNTRHKHNSHRPVDNLSLSIMSQLCWDKNIQQAPPQN
jgi:hypothetical protein